MRDESMVDERDILGRSPRVGRRGPGTSARPDIVTVFGRPAWIVAGQSAIVLFVVIGFHALQPVKPNVFVALLLLCLGATIGLGPSGRVRRIVLTAPVAALITWWMLSGAWTFNLPGFRRDTTLFIPMLVVIVAIVGLLPITDIYRGLLAGCQVAIAWTVIFTITNPATAMRHPGEAIPGWVGSFIHKNSLAPFMLFAVLVAWSFEPHRTRRRLMYAVAGFFIVMSQSTTVLAIGFVLVPLGLLVRRLARLNAGGRSALLLVTFVGCVAFGVALISAAETLLASRGKDLTFTSRTDIWTGAIDAIEQRPLLGYGAGGVWMNPNAEPARSILRGLGFPVFHAHNGYLEVLLQLGAVGLGIVVLLMILVFRFGALELVRDVDVGVFMMLFVLLIALMSLSEVTTMGAWLVLLCAFQTIAVRVRRVPSENRMSTPVSGPTSRVLESTIRRRGRS
jgi:exopolysaccharide production protein ExoQ